MGKDREKAEKIRAGDVRTASRLIRNIEDEEAEARHTLRHIFPHTGRAHIVGITGSPGAGKSTLTDALIARFRKQDRTVGVLAVDPTSPFTGGAILGDRVRMQRHAEDPGVFVRSLATRGALGGLSKAVGDAIHILDAMGKDIIIVETVGTGQQEVDVINHAHTVLVVLVPGMGDDVQILKAGIMEIADIFVVNKADRDGTAQLVNELMAMLHMASTLSEGWRPPIVRIGNAFEPESFRQGIEELGDRVDAHYRHLIDADLLGDRLRRKTMMELHEAIRACVLEPVLRDLIERGELERMAQSVLKKQTDPYTAADSATRSYLRQGSTDARPDPDRSPDTGTAG